MRALVVAALLALSGATAFAQSAPAPKPTRPLTSKFLVQKVVVDNGVETLEDASNVTIGDIVQYSAQHTNISGRRLLKVDFAIPIPFGTTYVEGSAVPEGAVRTRLTKEKEQMLWRVEKLEPQETVELRMRVRIDPDPSLRSAPMGPRKPELRRGQL